MSTLFSLGCVVLLYFTVRKAGGDTRQAFVAASLMALAPVQLVLSQQARPYTLIQFIALVAAAVLLSIQQKNWSWPKLSILTLAIIALALTHYFSIGLIAAFIAYSILRLRGKNRIASVSAILIAVTIAAAAWGPNFLAYNQNNPLADYGRIFNRTLAHITLSVPQRLIMESNYDQFLSADDGPWTLVISLAILTFLIPVVRLRSQPHLLFWWLWVAGEVGLIFMIDVVRHSTLLTITRYVTLAAPAVYALLAVPLPGRIGKLSPWIILFGALVFAVDYLMLGPPNSPDVRSVANLVRRQVSPRDVVIITGNYYYTSTSQESSLTYFLISHYGGPWKCPVVFATAPLSRQTQRQLQRYNRIWVIGIYPGSDTQRILPGWQVHDIHGPGDSNLLWYVTPPTTEHS